MSKLVFHSFLINRNYKSHDFLDKKEVLLDHFAQFLELQILNFKKGQIGTN